MKKLENGKLAVSTNHDLVVDDVDCLIWAIGRDPNVKIGLENTSIKLDAEGHIVADE